MSRRQLIIAFSVTAAIAILLIYNKKHFFFKKQQKFIPIPFEKVVLDTDQKAELHQLVQSLGTRKEQFFEKKLTNNVWEYVYSNYFHKDPGLTASYLIDEIRPINRLFIRDFQFSADTNRNVEEGYEIDSHSWICLVLLQGISGYIFKSKCVGSEIYFSNQVPHFFIKNEIVAIFRPWSSRGVYLFAPVETQKKYY